MSESLRSLLSQDYPMTGQGGLGFARILCNISLSCLVDCGQREIIGSRTHWQIKGHLFLG